MKISKSEIFIITFGAIAIAWISSKMGLLSGISWFIGDVISIMTNGGGNLTGVGLIVGPIWALCFLVPLIAFFSILYKRSKEGNKPLLSAQAVQIFCFSTLILIFVVATFAAIQNYIWWNKKTAEEREQFGGINAILTVQPYCCPPTALEVRTNHVIQENNFKWLDINPPIPKNINSVSGVEICYEIKSSVPGQTYISQTRLTDSTKPNVATVKLDDGTDRKDLGPACYTTTRSFKPEGDIVLRLKVVFGNVNDSIIINSTKLLFE